MRFEKMDRRIVIEQPSVSRNSYGEDTRTWSTLVTAWAQVIEGTVNERFTADSRREQRMVVFRIRYRTGITTGMRVNYGGRYYNILGTKELERRRGLDLDTEYIQSAQDGI